MKKFRFCLLMICLLVQIAPASAAGVRKVFKNAEKTAFVSQKINAGGNWRVTFVPQGDSSSSGRMDLRLKQTGGRLTVSSYSYVGGDRGVWKNQPNGVIKGNRITLYFEEKGERAVYRGTVSGNRMSGTLSFGGTWTAVRL